MKLDGGSTKNQKAFGKVSQIIVQKDTSHLLQFIEGTLLKIIKNFSIIAKKN
jgi:hypothetical protein